MNPSRVKQTPYSQKFLSPTCLARAVGALFACGGVSLALAQDVQNLQRVEITGSNIKRIEGETALPVQVITREEIQNSGAPNVETFLQTLGVAVQGNSNIVPAASASQNAGMVSGVSLRGLGSQRTLVLINGRRVSAGGRLRDSMNRSPFGGRHEARSVIHGRPVRSLATNRKPAGGG
ncbi:MAG: TonB-dependent receptor plug domain-containing protein [Sterolibacteriaceae bacterium]|nr:TonB-dependent receptor plug domain-containing protein [Candidatus Methylophosphatis haderslevensis]